MENYFRNRKEIEEFFENEFFVFAFSSSGLIYFNTLRPVILGGELYDFQIAFFNSGEDFFNYSSFTEWLDKFEIESVNKVQKDNSFEMIYSNDKSR